MARGWESKSVESQMEEAAEDRRLVARQDELSANQLRIQRERESLQLSRERILRELQATTIFRRQEQLSAALAHLDKQIAALG